MTGPEHYREAEQLLASAGFLDADRAGLASVPVITPSLLLAAQVHATLALAAATAANDPDPKGEGQSASIHNEWTEVITPVEGGDRS